MPNWLRALILWGVAVALAALVFWKTKSVLTGVAAGVSWLWLGQRYLFRRQVEPWDNPRFYHDRTDL